MVVCGLVACMRTDNAGAECGVIVGTSLPAGGRAAARFWTVWYHARKRPPRASAAAREAFEFAHLGRARHGSETPTEADAPDCPDRPSRRAAAATPARPAPVGSYCPRTFLRLFCT